MLSKRMEGKVKGLKRWALVMGFALAFPLWAEVNTNNNVSVTQTSQTITIGTTQAWATEVLITNDSVSANKLFYRLFCCSETPAAATTSSIRLERGESHSYKRSATSCSNGYCAATFACATSETATARIVWQ